MWLRLYNRFCAKILEKIINHSCQYALHGCDTADKPCFKFLLQLWKALHLICKDYTIPKFGHK